MKTFNGKQTQNRFFENRLQFLVRKKPQNDPKPSKDFVDYNCETFHQL